MVQGQFSFALLEDCVRPWRVLIIEDALHVLSLAEREGEGTGRGRGVDSASKAEESWRRDASRVKVCATVIEVKTVEKAQSKATRLEPVVSTSSLLRLDVPVVDFLDGLRFKT